MATITLDVSEYDLMRDKTRLLEESLDRERELSEKLEALKDEKIKEVNAALESARIKVVTVHESHTHSTVYRSVPSSAIRAEISAAVRRNNGDLPEHEIDRMLTSFFTRTEGRTIEPSVYTTTQGIDEFKAELKKSYYADMDVDTAARLKDAEAALSMQHDLVTQVNKLEKDARGYNKTIDRLELSEKDLTEKVNLLQKIVDDSAGMVDFTHKVINVFNAPIGMFEKGKTLDIIKSHLLNINEPKSTK